MTIITTKQAAALRLMVSIEKTARCAELIRVARAIENSDTDIAMQVAVIHEAWAKTDVALECATSGQENPEAQLRIPLADDVVQKLHAVVLAGAYTNVNPEATQDDETLALTKTLFELRNSLLKVLEDKLHIPRLFCASPRGPVVFH